MTPRTRGQGLVEYALVLILIAIVVIGILSLAGVRGGVRCSGGTVYDPSMRGCVSGYTPER